MYKTSNSFLLLVELGDFGLGLAAPLFGGLESLGPELFLLLGGCSHGLPGPLFLLGQVGLLPLMVADDPGVALGVATPG